MAAAGRAAGRSRSVRGSSRSCPCPPSSARAEGFRPRLRAAEDDRQSARLLRAVRCLRPLLRVHPLLRPGASGDVRGGGPERELPARAAEGHLRPAPFDRLCMHEFVLSAPQAQARARRHDARRRQAADGLRLSSADDLLPADRSRGADDRADRDRGEGNARRLLPTQCWQSRARRPGSPSC